MKIELLNRSLVLVGIICVLNACSVEPKKINYGADACHYCKMNIVDKQHAAQYVTKKGKAYKFDAIECMLNDIKTTNYDEVALFLVADYSNPGTLTDALQATYLISESIPSPMGAFLSGFSSKEGLEKLNRGSSDEILSWEQLLENYKD